MLSIQFNSLDDSYYVDEPRLSWFGKPLWKTNANRVVVSILSNEQDQVPSNSANFDTTLTKYYIYLTTEEMVMWKLMGIKDNGSYHYDMKELFQGVVYT